MTSSRPASSAPRARRSTALWSRRPPPDRERALGRTAFVALVVAAAAAASAPASARRARAPAQVSAPPRAGTPEALWVEARRAVSGDQAAARYRILAERFSHHPLGQAALCELGDYEYARGEYEAARRLYRRVRGSETRRARLGEALAAFALGNPGRARELTRPLLGHQRDAIGWRAALLVAQSWEAERRVPETLAAYRRLLALPPGPAQPSALLGAARAAERAGEDREAARALEILRARYPDSPEAAEARSAARPPGAFEAGPAPEAEAGGDKSASRARR